MVVFAITAFGGGGGIAAHPFEGILPTGEGHGPMKTRAGH